MQKANAEDDSDVAVLTATFALNKTYADGLDVTGEYLPMESLPFEVKLEFGKYTEPVEETEDPLMKEGNMPQNEEELRALLNGTEWIINSAMDEAEENAIKANNAFHIFRDIDNICYLYVFFNTEQDASAYYAEALVEFGDILLGHRNDRVTCAFKYYC